MFGETDERSDRRENLLETFGSEQRDQELELQQKIFRRSV